MTDITSVGVIITLSLLVLYALKIFIVDIVLSKNSLHNIENTHNFLLFSAGALFGIALNFNKIIFTEGTDLVENLMSILFLIVSIFTFVFGLIYMQNKIYYPLEQITEYSINFGRKFIATRIPLINNRELSAFALRFNENSILLANKIADAEIQIDMLNHTNKFFGEMLNSQNKRIEEFANNFDQILNNILEQNQDVVRLNETIDQFITWYEDIQTNMTKNLQDLKSLSNVGSLLSINASIEASNLEVELPGFITIAEKLHELAKDLEVHQEVLNKLISDLSLRSETFQQNLTNQIEKIVLESDENVYLIKNMENMIKQLYKTSSELNKTYDEISNNLVSLRATLPSSY